MRLRPTSIGLPDRIRTDRIRRRAAGLAILIAAPLLTTIATATPASACVTDPDPWFGDLGELTLPGNVPFLFTNGDFVLEVDGRRTI